MNRLQSKIVYCHLNFSSPLTEFFQVLQQCKTIPNLNKLVMVDASANNNEDLILVEKEGNVNIVMHS